MSSPPSSNGESEVFVNLHKQRKGLHRLIHAFDFSLAGLKAGWGEAAFRLEASLAFVMLPLAFWLGRDWMQTAMLVGCVVLVMAVELLNTAIEAAIDRIGPERHPLSKKAKDMGSAAVLLVTVLALFVWGSALWALMRS